MLRWLKNSVPLFYSCPLLVSPPDIFQARESSLCSCQWFEDLPSVGFLARGAQSIPNGSPAHGEGTHSEEEDFAVEDEDSDGELNTWELSEGVSDCPPKEQAADLFNEDWDLELKADQGNPYGGCSVSRVPDQVTYQATPRADSSEEGPTSVGSARYPFTELKFP